MRVDNLRAFAHHVVAQVFAQRYQRSRMLGQVGPVEAICTLASLSFSSANGQRTGLTAAVDTQDTLSMARRLSLPFVKNGSSGLANEREQSFDESSIKRGPSTLPDNGSHVKVSERDFVRQLGFISRSSADEALVRLAERDLLAEVVHTRSRVSVSYE